MEIVFDGVTYSTFEEDDKRFDTNGEDFMTKTKMRIGK